MSLKHKNQSYVMTVLGQVKPSKLGITDAHNHLWIDPSPSLEAEELILNDFKKISAELIEYRSAGGQTILDCQPPGCGRNSLKLAELSRQCKVHVVACTGFHLEKYYSPEDWLWKAGTDQLTDFFCKELSDGMIESISQLKPVFPGFIKAACEAELKATHRPLLEAAVNAALWSKCLLMIHTEKGLDVENILKYLLDLGINSKQIMLCHVDKRFDVKFHVSLAQSGVLLEYDTFFRPKYHPDKRVWLLVEKMVSLGFENSIALASDMADFRMWKNFGGDIGLAGFPSYIRNHLFEMKIEPKVIKKLIGENIAKRISIYEKQLEEEQL